MIWKKSLISMAIFSVLFIGAWYEHNSHKRIYQEPTVNVEDMMLQDSIISTSNQLQTSTSLDNPIFTPFKSREYIRIVSQPNL